MKNIVYIFILLVFVQNQILAQVNRQVVPNTQTTPQKYVAPDPLESTMTFLKKELILDSFQEAAIKIYVKENIESSEKITAQNISYDEKMIQYEKIITVFDEKVIKILNPNQLKKFQELQAKRTVKKQPKKKKSKKEEEQQEK